MNEADPLGFSITLAEHFPQATDGDARLCWQKLSRFDRKVAREAVEQHRLELGSRAFRPDPVKLESIARFIDGTPGVDSAQRTSEYLAEHRAEEKKIQARRDEVWSVINELEFHQMEELKERALERLAKRLGTEVTAIFRRLHPLKSHTLKDEIARIVTEEGGVAA